MALLTAFVGSVGLMGTMGMNVMERTREIGVMRAIGAVELKVMQSVFVEGGISTDLEGHVDSQIEPISYPANESDPKERGSSTRSLQPRLF